MTPQARWTTIINSIKADIVPAVGKMTRRAGDGGAVRSLFMISSWVKAGPLDPVLFCIGGLMLKMYDASQLVSSQA